jgi:hypothetical protein
MAVKILVTALGQQIVSETKQIENKETGEIVGYWLDNPRVVLYNRPEGSEPGDTAISVGFGSYCLVSDEQNFSLRADHVVAILEPRDDVAKKYDEVVFSFKQAGEKPEEQVLPNALQNIDSTNPDEPNSTDPVAVGSSADLAD